MRHSPQFKLFLLVTSYLLLVTGLCGCQSRSLYKDSQIIMGTFVEVVSPDERAADIVFDEIRRIDGLMSRYKEDSEVSRINKLGELNLSADTLYVLKKARQFWEITEGAFDITIGPLMDLWGFTDKEYRLPKEEEIMKALERVGMDKIIFNNENNVVKFRVSGLKIDLGGIAKGYAVDCAVRKLKEKGINSCLINAGGDIYCLGDKPRTFGPFEFIFNKKVRGKFGKPWNIAVKNPRSSGFLDYLKLKDKAVATSGDYEQYFVRDRRRYSHIFNPKTGYPVNSGVISVTVIAPDGLTADALATSIFVLGKERGEALAKKFEGVEVKIIEEKDITDV